MKKKVFALVLAAAMTAGTLAGCGSSGTSSSAGSGSSSASASGSSSAAIKIGGIGPITGAAAVYGLATRNGAQIAVDEINAKGGLQFELNFQDDENDAEKSVNAYHNLQVGVCSCSTAAPLPRPAWLLPPRPTPTGTSS